jgi:hypothetical protein
MDSLDRNILNYIAIHGDSAYSRKMIQDKIAARQTLKRHLDYLWRNNYVDRIQKKQRVVYSLKEDGKEVLRTRCCSMLGRYPLGWE